MIFFRLILTNLLRHRVRSMISVAGIAFSVAAMLTVVTILEGAVGMFSNILSNDSEMIVFERDVSDLFFSSVPSNAVTGISSWPMVYARQPCPLRNRVQCGSSHRYLFRNHGFGPADTKRNLDSRQQEQLWRWPTRRGSGPARRRIHGGAIGQAG